MPRTKKHARVVPEPSDPKKRESRRQKPRVEKEEIEIDQTETPKKPLWQSLFFVGTEFAELPAIFNGGWSFENLDKEFAEGVLTVPKPKKKQSPPTPRVYLFAQTEGLTGEGTNVQIVPVVIAAVSTLPPSESMGIASVQMDPSQHQVLSLRHFKLNWMPIDLLDPEFWENIGSTDPAKLIPSPHFTLAFEQRHFCPDKMEKARKDEFTFSLPYVFNPFRGDDSAPPQENSLTVVTGTLKVITASGEEAETAVTLEYDYKEDDIEETVKGILEQENLDQSRADDVRAMIEAHVKKCRDEYAKQLEAYHAKMARLSEPEKASLKELKLFKFYPSNWTGFTTPFVNRYYGAADRVFSGPAAPAPTSTASSTSS